MVGRIPVPHQVQRVKGRTACVYCVHFYLHYDCNPQTAPGNSHDPQIAFPPSPSLLPSSSQYRPIAYSINTPLERGRSPQKSEAGKSTPATPARAYSPRVRSYKSSKPSEVRSIDYPIYQLSAQTKALTRITHCHSTPPPAVLPGKGASYCCLQ